MIIRTISDALRRQDWAVVVIELVIVVVGIFLGLQVDDWNEDRKQRQQEATYLEKLGADAAAMRDEIAHRFSQRTERIERMTRALRALERCDETIEATEDIGFALGTYQQGPGVDYLSATYDEMVETGSLARLGDPQLKHAISRAFTRVVRFNEQIITTRVSLPVVDAVLWKRVAYSIDESSGWIIVPDLDVSSLCGDNEVRSAFVEMIDMQVDGRVAAGRALEAMDELLALLPGT